MIDRLVIWLIQFDQVRSPTFESLPGVDDAVAVAVEESHVLLKHAHAAGVAPLGPVRMVRVHRHHSPREICGRGQRRER